MSDYQKCDHASDNHLHRHFHLHHRRLQSLSLSPSLSSTSTSSFSPFLTPSSSSSSKQTNNNNNNNNDIDNDISTVSECDSEHRWQIIWPVAVAMIALHLIATVGVWHGVTRAHIATLVWYFALIQFGATGIICGAHRLWTHRAYRATIGFRIFLMLCNTLAFQYDIYTWSRWHRVHHKFSDTDADPHNARRGFFFAHIGWVMVRHHPAYIAKSKIISMTDLDQDPVVQFQRRYYIPLILLIWLAIPVTVPWYFWNENLAIAFELNLFRYALSLHQTSLVNSAAHLFGSKTYDCRLMPTANRFTTAVTMGEAYHNYHHAFPWDYSASEFGWTANYNPMTAVIDAAASLGFATDRKKASERLIEQRIRRYGDIERIDAQNRVPSCGVVLDTIRGAITLFWALWIILFARLLLSLWCAKMSIDASGCTT